MNPNSNNINSNGVVRLNNATGGFTGSTDAKLKVLPSNPFVSFGWLIFTVSLIACASIYIYNKKLNEKENIILSEIKAYKKSVDSLDLGSMRSLMDKLTTFNELAIKHNRPSTILNFLEVITNKHVEWISMEYRLKDKDKYQVSLAGNTLAYKYVIQQMDELLSDKYKSYIKGVSLTALTKTSETSKSKSPLPNQPLDSVDKVSFNVTFELNNTVDVINFDKYLDGYKGIKSQESTSTRASVSDTNKVSTSTNERDFTRLLNMMATDTKVIINGENVYLTSSKTINR